MPYLVLSIAMTACTHQAWYESVKEGASNHCRNQPPGEVASCLERLNTKTYEDYERERSGQK